VRLGIKNPLLSTTPTEKFVLEPFNSTEAPFVPQLMEQLVNYLMDAVTDERLEEHSQDLLAKQKTED
jgi:peptidyl-tRNA hydrolase